MTRAIHEKLKGATRGKSYFENETVLENVCKINNLPTNVF